MHESDLPSDARDVDFHGGVRTILVVGSVFGILAVGLLQTTGEATWIGFVWLIALVLASLLLEGDSVSLRARVLFVFLAWPTAILLFVVSYGLIVSQMGNLELLASLLAFLPVFFCCCWFFRFAMRRKQLRLSRSLTKGS